MNHTVNNKNEAYQESYSMLSGNAGADTGGDNTTIPRQYWFDSEAKCLREVWRPGDGDGNQTAEHHDQPGVPPLAERWRFYQYPEDDNDENNEHEIPKFVVLDERAVKAAYDLPVRSDKTRYWSYDMAVRGLVRSNRPHRGKAVIENAEVEGIEKHAWLYTGRNRRKYYLTGEASIKLYDTLEAALAAHSAQEDEHGDVGRKRPHESSGVEVYDKRRYL